MMSRDGAVRRQMVGKSLMYLRRRVRSCRTPPAARIGMGSGGVAGWAREGYKIEEGNTSRAKDNRDLAGLKFPYAQSSACFQSTSLYVCTSVPVWQSVLLSSVLFFMSERKLLPQCRHREIDEATPTQWARYETSRLPARVR